MTVPQKHSFPALISLVQLSLFVTLFATVTMGQTPVGYWKFDDGSGITAADSSGNGHPATLVNGVSWVAGQIGDAVSANAANSQYVSIPAINLSTTRAVTVAFWTKRSYSVSGEHALFEATADFTKSNSGFAFFPDDAICGGVQAALKGDVGETANCYNQPSSGVWHHLAVVYDKTQSAGYQVAFYVDGVLQNPTRNLNASTNTNYFGNNPIYLFSQGGTKMFDSGVIDDVRVYATALTAARIQHIYQSATVTGTYNSAGLAAAAPRTSRDAASQQAIAATSNVGTGITLDVHGVQDNGASANSTAAVSIGTPTAGDLITCEVTFDGHNGNALVSVSDNKNGSYVAAVPVHLNTTLIQWFGIYYKQAVVGSPTSVTLKTTNSQQWSAISCQAWKGAATSNALDTGFVQSRDVLSTANPTTGANKTPAGNGELVIAGLGLYTGWPPTAGANYNLIDSAAASQWWPEYWIQTTASPTAGNFIRGSDNFTDMMAAFKPATVAGTFTIAASPASLSVVQGNQGTSTITTTVSGGFSNAITLSASGVPAGTTARFSLNPIAAPGVGSSTLTLTVGSGTAVGTYPITVTGNGGGIQRSTTVTLTVTAAPNFTISAAPASLSVVKGNQGTSTITTTVSGGFSNAITLSASGVPSGTTVSFNPNSIAALPGAGNSTITVTVGRSTLTGTYPITVIGKGGGFQHSTTVTLKVTAPGSFTTAASPASLSVVQGNQGTSTITTTVSGGFSNAITLSASGVPAGTTARFSLNPIPAPGVGSSTLTLTVGSSTAVGTYPITVTGNGGGIQRSTTVILTVTAAPNFTISAAPASLSVVQGNQGTSTITTTVSGGFSNAITLSASGVPSGTTVSFNPNSIAAPGAGNSTMTVTVGSSTLTGTYPITVIGKGGGTQHTAKVNLTVTAQVALSWTASTSPAVVGYNAYSSTISGGSYTKLNSSLISNTSYTDQTVRSGNTYYYVTTAVDSQGNESVYSNQAVASVP